MKAYIRISTEFIQNSLRGIVANASLEGWVLVVWFNDGEGQ